MTLVSVVIPTKNRAVAIFDAVQSVFEGTYQHFEIFVVDQSDDNATQEVLAPFFKGPRFHYRLNRRPGYGAASSRNIGIALSSGDIIASIDDDVTVCADWMEKLVAEFKADPDLMFILGKLTAPPYDHATGFTPETDPQPGLSNWKMTFVVAGANISFRRSFLFEQLGGYDELCGPGSRLRASDDGDIALRVVRSKAKWKPCPHIEVIHKHGFKPGKAGSDTILRYQFGNGGNYGRQTRRGDLIAGGFFLSLQLYYFVRYVVPVLLHGRKSEELTSIKFRLQGFWKALNIPRQEGFVGPEQLKAMRQKLLAESAAVEQPQLASW